MKFDPVLQAKGLSKSYRQGDREIVVLKDIDLTVSPGETLAVVGVSGSGKSTLLHLLAGLDTPDAGSVTLAGQDLAGLNQTALGRLRNARLGFVYQFHHLLPEFNALENVAMPLMIGGGNKKMALETSIQLLDRVGLMARADHHPGELSGGERQRVAIARALATGPDIVLADEPTGNLDEESGAQVHEVMLMLAVETGTAFVVVTHNPGFADRMQRLCRLHGGQLEMAR